MPKSKIARSATEASEPSTSSRVEKLEAQFGFSVPKEKGLTTVDACEGIIKGSVKVMVQLGGNLVRSVPDHNAVVPGWRNLRLAVQVLTKLNKSCVVHGEISYILPCLGRIEVDRQASGPQAVAVEDSTGCMHGSRGVASPASEHLRSEPAIIAGIAKATLAPNPKIDWDGWVADYSKIRDAIAETYPEIFHDFNAQTWHLAASIARSVPSIANGRRKPARQTSSRPRAYQPTLTRRSKSVTYCSSLPCAVRASSTRRDGAAPHKQDPSSW